MLEFISNDVKVNSASRHLTMGALLRDKSGFCGQKVRKYFPFMMTSWIKSDSQNNAIKILVFSFPVLVATMQDAGSVIYAILVLAGLFHCKEVWTTLNAHEKRFLIGLALFFGASIVSLLMTEDLREGIKRIERYVRLPGLIPIYLMLRKKQIIAAPFYFMGMLAASYVMGIQAYYEVEVLDRRIASGAYHKIIFGNQAILAATYVVCGVYYAKNKWHYSAAIVAILSGVYASLLSGTRTSWLFVPFILLALAVLYRKKMNRKIWTISLSGVFILISVIILLKPARLFSGFESAWNDIEVFQENPDTHTSLGARLVMWRNSVLIFKESPFLGTGTGDFRNDSRRLLEKGVSHNNQFAVNQSNAHNLYFQLLAEGGLVGLFLMILTLFIIPFRYLYRLWQNIENHRLHCFALSGLIGIMAFVWFGVSESWVNRNPIMTTYCMTVLVFLSSAVNAQNNNVTCSDEYS